MEITTIAVNLPFKMGKVNSYLLKGKEGFVLLDCGTPKMGEHLARELFKAGCKPGDLKLIVITHGDFDHTGSAAELRTKLGAKIGMHAADAGMAETADMFWNRKKGNKLLGWLIPVFFGFKRECRFSPDVLLEDGYDLREHGVEAKVVHIPGHSKGSISILTCEGDLICGDLFSNTDRPKLNDIMDDPETAAASLQKLKGYALKTVYPGHGGAFAFEQLMIKKNTKPVSVDEVGCPKED